MRRLPVRAGSASLKHGAASLVILLVLGLQGAAIVNGLTGVLDEPPAFLWPFVDYPMYCGAQYPGAVINRFVVVGTTVEGQEITLGRKQLRLDFWQYLHGPVKALQRGRREMLADYLSASPTIQDVVWTTVRLENHPYVLEPGGLRTAPTVVLASMPMTAQEPARP